MHIRFITLLILISFVSNAQIKNIYTIEVKNSNTKQPIQFASLFSINKKINTVADENGIAYFDRSNNSEFEDTIIISCTGYNDTTIKLTNEMKITVLLREAYTPLTPINVLSTRLTWGEIMYKTLNSINPQSKTAFESDFSKRAEIIENNEEVVDFYLKGKAHDEGFDINQLINNRQDYSWFLTDSVRINKRKKISGITNKWINDFTIFESRSIKFLFPLSIAYYEYSLLGIEMLESDTVYKVKSVPKKNSEDLLRSIDKKVLRPFTSLLLCNKTYYIKKKTFEILRIDFDQTYDYKVSYNGITQIAIEGVVKYLSFDKAYHPFYINVKHLYKVGSNNYTRVDEIVFNNIKPVTFSNDQLLLKYNLKEIKGNFPNRTILYKDIESKESDIFIFYTSNKSYE
ncbi:MAG: hypothetical protein K2Y12_10280 [Chitinophagaceae bacterium]|nr:hypothetical protein [Chitinophagaceae bacterium]